MFFNLGPPIANPLLDFVVVVLFFIAPNGVYVSIYSCISHSGKLCPGYSDCRVSSNFRQATRFALPVSFSFPMREEVFGGFHFFMSPR